MAATAGARGAVRAIPRDVADQMRGASWHPQDPRCPPLDALALVCVAHWDLTGEVRDGELVVAREVAEEILAAFEALFAEKFPIARMDRIDAFGGDDDASMAANNCSAFNFRTIAGTDRLSQHALGLAVDINPLFNPWVRPAAREPVLPTGGAEYLALRRRGEPCPGMIVRPGPVTAAFDACGWTWGGDWPGAGDPGGVADYHHFSKHPR